MTSELRNRTITPEDGWRLPAAGIVPPGGVGIVTPSCQDRTQYAIPIRAGVGLRIGGEARLCFECGPEGSVYHPADENGDTDEHALGFVLRLAGELTGATGYDPDELTPDVLSDFEAELRRYFERGNA
jgi:hypothetical protein